MSLTQQYTIRTTYTDYLTGFKFLCKKKSLTSLSLSKIVIEHFQQFRLLYLNLNRQPLNLATPFLFASSIVSITQVKLLPWQIRRKRTAKSYDLVYEFENNVTAIFCMHIKMLSVSVQ
jgi:hypothetical protein